MEQHSEARLTTALLSLIDLASTPKIPSRVFKPHLSNLLSFALSIIVPSPVRGSLTYSEKAMDETVRTPAIEYVLRPSRASSWKLTAAFARRLLVSIAETAPTMVKSHLEVTQQFVPALMQVMTEVEEDSDWLKAEVIQDDEDESMAIVAESSLDRIARALGELAHRGTREAFR